MISALQLPIPNPHLLSPSRRPLQDTLAHKLKALVPSLTWVRTCGGLFDFLSGERSRAPAAMQNAGFEWAYRMALEPRRLAWRYATTNTHALYLIVMRSGRPLPAGTGS